MSAVGVGCSQCERYTANRPRTAWPVVGWTHGEANQIVVLRHLAFAQLQVPYPVCPGYQILELMDAAGDSGESSCSWL